LPFGHVDGNLARRQAAADEQIALRQYHEALKAFNDLADRRQQKQPPAALQTVTALTPREREVLKLIVAGLTSREIAAELRISFKTVVTHRSRIMDKLNVHDVASLVRCAIRNKLAEA
jgi:DNA-binding NarL/FixJ family response regulator